MVMVLLSNPGEVARRVMLPPFLFALMMTIESKDGIFEGTIWVNVHDVEEVRNICDTLKKVKNIQTIARID